MGEARIVQAADFAVRLRETMRARGLGYSELAGLLAGAGAPISPATLSYWASGRSRPLRRSSLGVVQALEQALGLEDGELVDLVDIDAETWRYRSAAEVSHLLPRGDEIEEVRRAWGVRWDDGLRREYVRTTLQLDVPAGQERLWYEAVLTGQREGADRLLAVLEVPVPALEENLRVGVGARMGRRASLPGGASVVEMVLSEPLHQGEAAVVEWSCLLPGVRERGRFLGWCMRPADLVVTEVQLPTGGGAWHVRRTVATVGRAGRRVDEVGEEDLGGACPDGCDDEGSVLQTVVSEVAATTCLLEWERPQGR